MATKEDARQPGNPGTLNKNCLNSGPRCHMHDIIPVLRSIKRIHFFLNHRPFLKFPERQKALHSLLLPDSLGADAIQLLAAFDAGPGDGLPLIRHLFVRKTQI